MAGSYPDVPAHRIAYDRDGSIGAAIAASGIITQLPASSVAALNAESEAPLTLPTSTVTLAIVLPMPVNLAAIFVAAAFSSPGLSVWTSTNTTNGLDGTWTQQNPVAPRLMDVKPNYRQSASLLVPSDGVAAQNVRGVRLMTGSSTAMGAIRALHIYGDPSSSATKNRISLWHPTLDIPLPAAYLDWGNVPRSTSDTRSFRIKNLSSTLTANDVVTYIDALTAGVPSVAGMHLLSDNGGGTFNPVITLPSLAPEAISSVLQVRRTVPNNAQVSLWSARIVADVTSWTE